MNKTLSTPKTYLKHIDRALNDLHAQIEKDCEDIRTEFEKSGKKINCAEFHRQLIKRYPFGRMVFSHEHIMTEIHGMFWDKRGLQFWYMPNGLDHGSFSNTFQWPIHNGPLDGTNDD